MESKLFNSDYIFNKFSLWYNSAKHNYDILNIGDYNAFSLSTVFNNKPSSRMLLLKSFSQQGFIFYTNIESRKGIDIINNKYVAMLFYWPILGRQVRIEGECHFVKEEIANQYFESRPYTSKIGAWSSKQSRKMRSYSELLEKVRSYKGEYASSNVPRPPYWKGVEVSPTTIEFWINKSSRLHLRKKYEKISQYIWSETLLFP